MESTIMVYVLGMIVVVFLTRFVCLVVGRWASCGFRSRCGGQKQGAPTKTPKAGYSRKCPRIYGIPIYPTCMTPVNIFRFLTYGKSCVLLYGTAHVGCKACLTRDWRDNVSELMKLDWV